MSDYDEPTQGGMMAEQEAYHLNKLASVGQGSLRTPPVRKILEQRIAEYEKLIEAHKKALAALDASPQTEVVLDTLRKLGI